MPTSIHHFTEPLPAERFDRYLTDGWRSTGQALYESHFLRTEEDNLYGCVQIRLPLTDFAFRARQRKLMNRNARRFTHRFARAEWPDPELRAVNRRYLQEHPDKSREDLEYHVRTTDDRAILDTWVLRVYEGEQLVAFSYFDLGAETMYSKAGIYDPRFHRASPGIYTMLLEIDFARQRGVRYYHPGYISRGYPVFNYKADLGPMEYRNVLTRRWEPLGPDRAAADIPDPLEVVDAGLHRIRAVIGEANLPFEILEYPSFTARYSGSLPERQYLDGALIGVVDPRWGRPPRVINFNFETGRWQYLHTAFVPLYDTKLRAVGESGRARQVRILAHGEPELTDADPLALARAVALRYATPARGY